VFFGINHQPENYGFSYLIFVQNQLTFIAFIYEGVTGIKFWFDWNLLNKGLMTTAYISLQ